MSEIMELSFLQYVEFTNYVPYSEYSVLIDKFLNADRKLILRGFMLTRQGLMVIKSEHYLLDVFGI